MGGGDHGRLIATPTNGLPRPPAANLTNPRRDVSPVADHHGAGKRRGDADDLVRLDRARKGKKLSNEDWTSPTDADAKITRMKDGTTHLAYKPEHAVDLDTGVIVVRRSQSPDPSFEHLDSPAEPTRPSLPLLTPVIWGMSA